MIDICIPYGSRPDLTLVREVCGEAWAAEGARPYFGEAWDESGKLFHHSRARNLAVAQGSAPWVLVVDVDMIPAPGAYAEMLAVIRQGEACYNLWNWRVPDPEWPSRVEASAPLEPHVEEWLAGGLVRWERVWENARAWQHNRTYGPVLLSRQTYEAVGGQHEGYVGWGCEDDDFFAVLKRHGTRLIPSESPRFIQAPHVSTRIVDGLQGTSYQQNHSLLQRRLHS